MLSISKWLIICVTFPGTLTRYLEEESAVNLPLPEDDDEFLEEEDEDEDEEEEEEDGEEEEGGASSQVQILYEVIEDLKQQLIALKREQLRTETRIRQEVCREMSMQLVEIENEYR